MKWLKVVWDIKRLECNGNALVWEDQRLKCIARVIRIGFLVGLFWGRPSSCSVQSLKCLDSLNGEKVIRCNHRNWMQHLIKSISLNNQFLHVRHILAVGSQPAIVDVTFTLNCWPETASQQISHGFNNQVSFAASLKSLKTMLNSKGYALDDFLQLMHKDKGFGEVPHHGLMLGPQNRWYSKVGMKDELWKRLASK